MNRSLSPEEEACARRLWSEAGFAGDFHAAPIAGGANNRVFRLSRGGQSALLKAYYIGADDPRDRLGAEVAFTRFLHSRGVTAAPRPLAWDREEGMALFEFIEGRKPAAGEVTKTHVLSALHGVVPAYRVIEPYDATVPGGAEGREWGRRVLAALRPVPGARWLVLAGSAYVDPWIDEARRAGVDVLDPLRGLALGERRSLASRCEGLGECARLALGLTRQEPRAA